LTKPVLFDNPQGGFPIAKLSERGKMLEDIQQRGIIEELKSTWSSLVVLVRKKNVKI
jgi:hypothetical protein